MASPGSLWFDASGISLVRLYLNNALYVNAQMRCYLESAPLD